MTTLLKQGRALILAAALLPVLACAATVEVGAAATAPTHTLTPHPPATERPYPTAVPYPTQVPYPTAIPAAPALSLSQTEGVTDTALIASGTHFPPGTVSLFLDDAPGVIGRGTVDSGGHARIAFAIPPDATVGGHEVRAIDSDVTSANASALVTVARPQGAVAGSGGNTTYCTGLLGWCPDLGGLITGLVGAAWNALTSGLNGTLHSLSAAILDPITRTPDLRGNQELTRVQGVLSQDATEAIAVLFGIAALWCVQPRFFGSVGQGVSLLWRSALVIATLRTLNPLMTLWTDAVNALAAGVGHANIADTGHTGLTLVIAPALLLIAGLERAVSLYTLGLCYAVAPIFIVLAIYPPAQRLCRAWLFLFISTSTMGVAYALATTMIVAMGVNDPSLWGDVMTLGGFFFLTLVPPIWGGLTLAAGQGTGGALTKAAGLAELALL